MMNKPLIYYLIGGALSAALVVYLVYSGMFLITNISAVSDKSLPKAQEIANFNLEKFEALKIF